MPCLPEIEEARNLNLVVAIEIHILYKEGTRVVELNRDRVFHSFIYHIQHISMATTRFKFRASSVSGKQGTLFIQVIHQRVARQVSTKYKLYPKEWDAGTQSVVIPKDASSKRSP